MTTRSMLSRCLISFVLAGVGLATVGGCGADDGLGKRVPVSGKVTYKGQPLAKGTVGFVPDDPAGRGASGDCLGGSYFMTTLTPGDGVIPGKYKVTISAAEIDLSKAEAEAHGGSTDQVSVAKAAKKAKRLIPAKYGTVGTSNLTVEVPGGTYDFNLTD